MPVIALTQGMGSLAKDVAEMLAADLGLRTVQHELADRVADKMHVSKSLINRLRFGKAGLIESMRADKQALALYSAEQVLEAAAQGNVVIRGWGATQLLRAVPHVPCIRILRPFDQRVSWLMKELDTEDREMAEDEIRRSDHANATRMHDQFGVDWGDPVLFDMALNTQRLSVRGCVEQIKTLLASPEFAETEESLALLRDLTLDAHVRTALRDDPATDHTNVNVSSAGGCVTLRGVVPTAVEVGQAEQVVSRLPGVKTVVNELRPMRSGSRFITSTDG